MREEEILAAARNPDGSPRFYPLGEHPATFRLREQRDRIAALPQTPETEEWIAHIDGRLEAFDTGEEQSKALYLLAVTSVPGQV